MTAHCSELFYEEYGDEWIELCCDEPLPHEIHRLRRTGRVLPELPEDALTLPPRDFAAELRALAGAEEPHS